MMISMPISIFFCFKVVSEYERAVIFRMGRLRLDRYYTICFIFFNIKSKKELLNKKMRHISYRSGGARGPGVFFVLPCIDNCCIVDMRTVSFDVPPQEVLTKDSVTVSVDAVVYYRISDPLKAVIQVNKSATWHSNFGPKFKLFYCRWQITVIRQDFWLQQHFATFWAPGIYRNY